MKWMSAFVFFFSAMAFANGYCPSAEMYKAEGWVVHDSRKFAEIEKQLNTTVAQGYADGHIEADLSGKIVVNDLEGIEIMLDVITLDDTRTDRDIMWGDYGIYTHHETKERVELRWYDGKKNLVINSKYIKCITGNPPIAENTIL